MVIVAAIVSAPPPAIGKTGAVSNYVDYIPPAIAGRYRINWTVEVTAATSGGFNVVLGWKNGASVPTSQPLGGSDPSGSALSNGSIDFLPGPGTFSGSFVFDIDGSSTPITLSTIGTFGGMTYNLSAILEQMS